MAHSTAPAGSHDLLLTVRGGFTLKGTSLSAWCRQHDIEHSYAHRALKGATNGPAAVELRKKLIAASRLEIAA